MGEGVAEVNIIYYGKPYIVEIGHEAVVWPEEVVTHIEWLFDEAFDTLSQAKQYADEASRLNKHVRVREREENEYYDQRRRLREEA